MSVGRDSPGSGSRFGGGKSGGHWISSHVDEIMNPFAREKPPGDDDRFDRFLQKDQRINPIDGKMQDKSTKQRARYPDQPNGKQFHEHGIARVAACSQRTDKQ